MRVARWTERIDPSTLVIGWSSSTPEVDYTGLGYRGVQQVHLSIVNFPLVSIVQFHRILMRTISTEKGSQEPP